MKAQNRIQSISKIYVVFSAFSLFSVSIMAFFSPQAVMDLVQVQLNNTDAYSSIRGVYGGVGFALVIGLLYHMRRHLQEAVGFLGLFWGLYAASRFTTIITEGALGAFGNRWLMIESSMCVIAFVLLLVNRRAVARKTRFVNA